MFFVLAIIPFFVLVFSFLIYKQTGKKEILKLDFVQFMYAFVIAPLLFIWVKTFVYILLNEEAVIQVDPQTVFAIDTGLSTLCLFIYAFVVIHSLTKSFEVKAYKDPLYDMFRHSELFHLWISHTGIYGLLLLLFSSMSLANVIFPMDLAMPRWQVAIWMMAGFSSGIFAFGGIWLSNFTQSKFMQIMKVFFGLFFIIHIVLYFVFHVHMRIQYGVYWFFFMSSSALVLCSFVVERSQKSMKFLQKFHHKHKDGWSLGNFLTIRAIEKKSKSAYNTSKGTK